MLGLLRLFGGLAQRGVHGLSAGFSFLCVNLCLDGCIKYAFLYFGGKERAGLGQPGALLVRGSGNVPTGIIPPVAFLYCRLRGDVPFRILLNQSSNDQNHLLNSSLA